MIKEKQKKSYEAMLVFKSNPNQLNFEELDRVKKLILILKCLEIIFEKNEFLF